MVWVALITLLVAAAALAGEQLIATRHQLQRWSLPCADGYRIRGKQDPYTAVVFRDNLWATKVGEIHYCPDSGHIAAYRFDPRWNEPLPWRQGRRPLTANTANQTETETIARVVAADSGRPLKHTELQVALKRQQAAAKHPLPELP